VSEFHAPAADNHEHTIVTLLAEVADVANETPSRFTVEQIKAARRDHRSSLGPRLGRYRRPALIWFTLIVVLAAVLVLGYKELPSPKPNGGRPILPVTRTTTPIPAAGVTSVSLPTSSWFNQISVSDERLLLTGEIASTGSNSVVCVAATFDPQTLQLGGTTKGSCNDPAIFGETIAAVNNNLPNSNNASISIARVDPRTGRVSVGPVIMTYAALSDTRPVMAYGRGSLWIYDVDTTNGPELVQVATSSGRVEDTIAMPQLYRPILAANDDGLWIGNSIEGSPAPNVLYHVSPGSSRATGVVSAGPLHTFWLVGSGDSIWAGIGPSFAQQSIWRFDGSDPDPVFRVSDDGYDPTVVVGDEADGLWTVVPYPPIGVTRTTGPYPEDVVSIDPNSGRETVVTVLPRVVLPSDDAGLTTGQSAFFLGSLFVLEPPFEARGYLGYSKLIRVTP
jgi:hypothetical protein